MSLVFFITDRATFTVELCFTVKRIHSDIDLFSMIVRNGIYCIYGLNVDPLWGPSRAFFFGTRDSPLFWTGYRRESGF